MGSLRQDLAHNRYTQLWDRGVKTFVVIFVLVETFVTHRRG